jgi:hypothetical protein
MGEGSLIEGVGRRDVLILGSGSATWMISLDLAPTISYFCSVLDDLSQL